ncbi:MAG TPA: hypothetical protein VJN18_20985 [Polyangiaceae bacterium]|nr:hypothetical protein [Polyangiaceae bacterium]
MASPTDPKNAPEREAPPDSGDPTPHPRYDEQLEGDAFEVMRKYQVVTLPPNARLELMKMKLPEAPPELLQDTVPPNGNVKGPSVAEPSDDGTTTDAPVVDHSRSNDTLIIPRVKRQQRLRNVVIAALCAGVALLLIGIVVTQGGSASDQAETAPPEVQVSPVNPASQPDAPAPAAATPSDQPATPAETASAKPTEKQPPRAPVVPARPSTPLAQPEPLTRPEPPKAAPQSPPPKPPASPSKPGSAFDGLMKPPSE